MTPSPNIVRVLEDSALEFESAIAGITEEQAQRRPGEGRWTALECVEHVVLAENRMRGLFDAARPVEAQAANEERESELARAVRDRSEKRNAPDPVAPAGRFATLADAMAGFRAARTASIRFAQAKGDELWSGTINHIRFGIVNGHELLILIAGHSGRHIPQIKEAAAS